MSQPVLVKPKTTFWALDGLRGVAALFVLLLHWFDGNLHFLFQYSRLAVDLFFLLSGFVIACSYDGKIKDGASLATYFYARIIRLYPLFVFGAALGALRFIAVAVINPATAMDMPTILSHFVLNILVIPVPGFDLRDQMFPLNLPAWSLFFEFIAYGLYGLVFRQGRNAWLIVAVIIGSTGVAGWILVEYAGGDKNSLWPGQFHAFFIAGMLRTPFSFCLGIWLWRHKDRFSLVSGKWFLWLALIIVVAFAMPQYTIPWPLLLLLVAVVFPLTLLSAVKTRVSAFQQKLYRHLGDLSYPLYITHVPFIWLMTGVLKVLFPEIPTIWFGVVVLPASIGFAYVVFYLFDKPLRASLRKRILPLKVFEKPAHSH